MSKLMPLNSPQLIIQKTKVISIYAVFSFSLLRLKLPFTLNFFEENDTYIYFMF